MGIYGVQMKGYLSWLARWACRSGTSDFYPALAALVSPYKIFFFLTTHFFTFCIPIANFPLLYVRVTICTALPRAEFFIEPPPDTQRKRRRGERGIGVTRGSYLLLTSLSPLPLSPHTLCALWMLNPLPHCGRPYWPTLL